MTWQKELCTVEYIYHHFENKNKFERVLFFFNDARYPKLGTFNVWFNKQCVLHRCDQVLFWWGSIVY